LSLLQNQIPHRLDPFGVVVQAPAEVKRLSAGMLEQFAGFVADFVQRFQAVGAEPGSDHEDPSDATAG